jgi:HD-like signal output (HDOD) protein
MAAMVRVLFVDNEARALDGLRRRLHSQKDVWEMQFVSSASEALRLIDQAPPDIVVTDLRLQEMDGAALLAEVEKRSPRAVRIVLSGMVNQRSFVESVGIAHQFLPKPFDPEALKIAIGRACDLRRWVSQPEVAEAIRGLGQLPPLPQTYRQLNEAVQREASLAEIGRIIAMDPSLTARVLQVANSAYFSPRRPIASAELAASFLGLEMLRPIVVMNGVGDSPTNADVATRLQSIWRHSLEVGSCARALAQFEKLSREEAAAAFSLGVMHDVGAILLAQRHAPVEGGDERRAADEVERAHFGLAHTEAGASLVLSWGLPDDIVEVVAAHHDARRIAATTHRTPGFLVAAACAFLDEENGGDSRGGEGLRTALQTLGASDRFTEWKRVVDATCDRASCK